MAFTDAVVGRVPAQITAARKQLVQQLGEAATVDAAAVASNFVRMVRIADATGIPLGEGLANLTAGVRRELHLEPRYN